LRRDRLVILLELTHFPHDPISAVVKFASIWTRTFFEL